MVAILGFGLFPVQCYMTKRLTAFVWHEDKVIPLMLFALATCTLSLTIYYIWTACIFQWPQWQCLMPMVQPCPDCFNVETFVVANVYLPNLPAFFLALAVILNVNKWIYYLLKIFAFINVGK